MENNMIIILGILSFFIIEKLSITLLSKDDDSHSHNHSHNHSHSSKSNKVNEDKK